MSIFSFCLSFLKNGTKQKILAKIQHLYEFTITCFTYKLLKIAIRLTHCLNDVILTVCKSDHYLNISSGDFIFSFQHEFNHL